jgi:L-ascorbate metabolism protein UlaG (beta-lactamase superfamily)
VAAHLEFVGLACFRMWQDGGPTIATDPYTPAVVAAASGLPDSSLLDVRLQADIVVVSSMTDGAHSNVGLVDGNPQVINALDVAQGKSTPRIHDEPVVALQAAESPVHPDGPDDNALYAMKVGGLWFLHMGDLGYGLTAADLSIFHGRCDVLLAIVGEKLTLSLDELDPMVAALNPTWIVPMHYRLAPMSGSGMTPVDVFLRRRAADPVLFPRSHTVTFPMPAVSAERPTIVVPRPSGYQPTEEFFLAGYV